MSEVRKNIRDHDKKRFHYSVQIMWIRKRSEGEEVMAFKKSVLNLDEVPDQPEVIINATTPQKNQKKPFQMKNVEMFPIQMKEVQMKSVVTFPVKMSNVVIL